MTSEPGFSAAAVMALSGATFTQFCDWTYLGMLPPANVIKSGTQWSFEDVVVARALVELAAQRADGGLVLANQGLSLALHLHHDAFGDYDAFLVIQGNETVLFPSFESAWGHIQATLTTHPCATWVNLGAHAAIILKEMNRHGQHAI